MFTSKSNTNFAIQTPYKVQSTQDKTSQYRYQFFGRKCLKREVTMMYSNKSNIVLVRQSR